MIPQDLNLSSITRKPNTNMTKKSEIIRDLEAKDNSIDDLKFELHQAKEELRRANTVIDALVKYNKTSYDLPW